MHPKEWLRLLSYQLITPAPAEGPRGMSCPAPPCTGCLYRQERALTAPAEAALKELWLHRTMPQGAGGDSCPARALACALLPVWGGTRVGVATLQLHRGAQPRAPIRTGAARLPRLPGPIVAWHSSAARARRGRRRGAGALPAGAAAGCRRRVSQRARILQIRSALQQEHFETPCLLFLMGLKREQNHLRT